MEVASWLDKHLARKVLAWSSRPTTNACPYVACGPKAHRTVTSAVRGLLSDDPRARGEFFALAGPRR